MINYSLKIDYSEVTATMARLVAATNPRVIHHLAARRAHKQTKLKYAERWRKEVDYDSGWQQTKREAQSMSSGEGVGFPLGPEPGFLTGTTFESIVAEATSEYGAVGPVGTWPQGDGKACVFTSEVDPNTGQAENLEVSKYFKWGNGRLEFLLNPSNSGEFAAAVYMGPFNMATMGYGRNGQAQWLYLDSEDINLLVGDLTSLIDSRIQDNATWTRAIYRRATYAEVRAARQEEIPTKEFIGPELPDVVVHAMGEYSVELPDLLRASRQRTVEGLVSRLRGIYGLD